MKPNKKYRVLGLMSGTSLDGLDIAFVEFTAATQWRFNVLASTTLPYSRSWHRQLETAHTLSGSNLMHLHSAYGRHLGEACAQFIKKNRIRDIDLIASHGHTVFHQPEQGFTFQLGDGSALHAVTGIPVVFDFRSLDVQLGGEGAPLVPVGDRLLFPSADVCLNLGGIANISMEIKGSRKAFDVCFCNMAMNHLMRETGKSYDRDGREASRGKVNPMLLDQLERAYRSVRSQRKSLGREFFEQSIQPLLAPGEVPLRDRLRTVCESVVNEIHGSLPASKNPFVVLATGGGARNKFLVEQLRTRLKGKARLELPAHEIIDFKEAIIFAFLGVLRLRNEVNVLRSVTRASRDSCSGVLVGV